MERPSVEVEGIILEAPDAVIVAAVKDYLMHGKENHLYPQGMKMVKVPEEATRNGVPADAYDAYRFGLMSACADVVCVRDTNGTLEVPLISRARPPFEGGWWVQGGAVFNFRPIAHFILWRLFREAGLWTLGIDEFSMAYFEKRATGLSCRGVRLVVPPLGVYRTAAEDSLPGKVCDTLNVACLTLWSADLPFGHDKDHTALRWVTLPELKANPNLCGHWNPQRLATRALQIVASAKR